MQTDRYVTYRAVPKPEPHCEIDGTELRIRTYGGPIPPDLDVEYREQVMRQIPLNGGEVLEVAVSDMPYIEALDHQPVHGFYDARMAEAVAG